MCGLVGVAGDIGHKERKAFKTLLLVDSLRGEDSTGVAIVSSVRALAPRVIKEVGPPHWLFWSKEYQDEIPKMTNVVLMGHNRSSTRGKISKENSHPFVFSKIIGAHNGTLSYANSLDKFYDFEVDSEALFYNIDEYGPEETIPKTSGAWALTWWNTESRTLHLLRNDERPLVYCYSKDRKTLFWASEPGFLHFALSRADIKYGTVWIVNKDTMYTWSGLNGLLPIEEATKSPLAGEEDLYGGYTYTYQDQTHNWNEDRWINDRKKNTNIIPFVGKKKEDDHFSFMFGDHAAIRIATKELLKKKGESDCRQCGDPIEENDEIALLGNEGFLTCMLCMENIPELAELLINHPDFFNHPIIN